MATSQVVKSVSDILAEGQRRLQDENPAMSVRSVARLIGISPSYWSKILRGEKRLTPTRLSKTVKALRFDLIQTAELQRSLLFELAQRELETETGLSIRSENKDEVAQYSALGKSDFWLLEKWFYLPLLNLISCSTFKSEIKWIATRLGVSEVTASEAINNLQRAGFLKISPNGEIQRTNLRMRFPTDRSHPQIRQFHRNMIEKALKHLADPRVETSFDQRLIAGVSFAADSQKIAEARLILERAMYFESTCYESMLKGLQGQCYFCPTYLTRDLFTFALGLWLQLSNLHEGAFPPGLLAFVFKPDCSFIYVSHP